MTRMFGHHIRSELVALYLGESIAVFVVILSLLAWVEGGEGAVHLGRIVTISGALALGSGIIAAASGLYQLDALKRASKLATSAVVATVLMIAIVLLVLLFLAPSEIHGSAAGMAGLLVLGTALGVLTARSIHAAACEHGRWRRRLLVIDDQSIKAIAKRAGDPDDCVAWLDRADLPMVMRPGWLRAQNIWAVVLPPSIPGEAELRRQIAAAGVRVMSDEQFQECRHNRLVYEHLPADWLHSARAARQNGLETGLRRTLDITVATTLLVVALPLMLITALLIRVDSNGPVFYRQVRCGLNGRTFKLIKFRSMRVDAEAAGVPVWASKADPRVTRLGRFMRLTRIDELPQLFNVLSGDMAMVGPRPERPGFVSQLGEVIPHYNDRAVVKPGITGWAQVNYPYGASVEDARMKLSYDLYYVRHCSLFLDFLILIATVRVVVFQEGAR